MKCENQALSDRLQTSHCDVTQLQQQVRELELSLSVSHEKHHTCQQEVIATICLLHCSMLYLILLIH